MVQEEDGRRRKVHVELGTRTPMILMIKRRNKRAPFFSLSFLPAGHGLSPGLARPGGLGDLALAAEGLAPVPVDAEAAEVGGAGGVAGLGVALLAAEAVLLVLLGALVVDGVAGAGAAAAGA